MKGATLVVVGTLFVAHEAEEFIKSARPPYVQPHQHGPEREPVSGKDMTGRFVTAASTTPAPTRFGFDPTGRTG